MNRLITICSMALCLLAGDLSAQGRAGDVQSSEPSEPQTKPTGTVVPMS